MDESDIFLFWAKTDREKGNVHTLIYHLIDVGAVTQVMWLYALPKQTQGMFSCWLGLNLTDLGKLIGFWASLHDIGKAAPCFQRKYQPAINLLTGAGFNFPALRTDQAYRCSISGYNHVFYKFRSIPVQVVQIRFPAGSSFLDPFALDPHLR